MSVDTDTPVSRIHRSDDPPKRPIPHDTSCRTDKPLAAMLATLPGGRRRVAEALVGGTVAPTYTAVAAQLGISLGTVHRHLQRTRLRHPAVHAALVDERRRQLTARHDRAIERAISRSRRWHRRQANRRYFERFGCWPWEPRGNSPLRRQPL